MKKVQTSKLSRNILTLLIAAMILCSCGNEAKDAYVTEEREITNYSSFVAAPQESYAEDLREIDMDFSVSDGNMYKAESPSQSDTAEITDYKAARKIIYNSSYDIDTKEFDKAVGALETLCDKYGAYMEKANTYASDGTARRAYYTVRVPVENYNSFVSEADSIGVVTRSSQDNKDVTESYYDTEARLESAKIREERVLEILKNSSKLDDVLALERELADIRYEIENFTGTLRKYDSLVSYATVDISINEVKEYIAPKTEVVSFGERMNSSFNEGINEFREGCQNLLVRMSYNFIPLIIWFVVLVTLAVVARVVIKKVRRRLKEWDKKEYGCGEMHDTDVVNNVEEPSENGKKAEKDGKKR